MDTGASSYGPPLAAGARLSKDCGNNALGDYAFTLAEPVVKGRLRPLNQPTDDIDGPAYISVPLDFKPQDRQAQSPAPVCAIIDRRRQAYPSDTWLFQVHCNRARNKPISRNAVSRALKDVGDTLGLKLNTHSMRKSRGKALYDAGAPIENIAKVLNHADTGVTLRYLGITRAAILQTYDDFVL